MHPPCPAHMQQVLNLCKTVVQSTSKLKKKYLQKIELSYQTVTLTSTDHLKFKATFVDNTVPHAYTILSDFPLPS